MQNSAISSMTKKCTKCGNLQSIDHFPSDLRLKSGLSSQCRQCHAIRSARYYANNRAKVKAATREWQRQHPERLREFQVFRKSQYVKISPDEWKRRKLNRKISRRNERNESLALLEHLRFLADIRRFRTAGIALTKSRHKTCPVFTANPHLGCKPCSKCRAVLPLSEFAVRLSSLIGRESACKSCDLIYRKRWASRNREKLAECARLRRARPDVKAKNAAIMKRWKKENPEKVSHIRKTYSAKRRSNLKLIRSDLTVAQWETIKFAYRHRCVYCGRRKPLTQDHVVPVSKPGSEHTASNIVPACRSCNSRKGAGPPKTVYQPHLIAG